MRIDVMKRSPSGTEQAFLHELIHAVLYCMGNPMYDDEAFVDTMSGLIHQALTSAKHPRPARKPREL
jgi:hypothetical protein